VAIAFKPSTLLSFHRAFVKQYWLLFSPKQRTKPAPKSGDRVQAIHVVELSSRSGSTKVSVVVFAEAANKTKSQRPNGRSDSRCGRDETTKSMLAW